MPSFPLLFAYITFFLTITSLIIKQANVTLSNSSNHRSILTKIFLTHKKQSNKFITARISGKSIAKQIMQIPDIARCSKKKPELHYVLYGKYYELFFVSNVENPYVQKFNTHLEYYLQIQFFLKKENQHLFKAIPMPSSSNSYQFKFQKKNQHPDDFFIFSFHHQFFVPTKITYVQNHSKRVQLTIQYLKTQQHLLPKTLQINTRKDNKIMRLYFDQYNVHPNINKNSWKKFQDDCPTLNNP